MPFTVRDLHSLIRALEKYPEWKAELRRVLLTEEVLSLPEIVRRLAGKVEELAEAQRRTEQRVGELAEAQRRTEQRVGELAEAQYRTEQEVRGLAEEVRSLAGEVARLTREVADLKGSDLERRYRERAASFFQDLVRRIRLVDHQDLGQLLDDALDAGRIGPEEKAEILRADLVLTGRRDGDQVYVLVEVSGAVDLEDVQRAARRAAMLEKATGTPVLPAVAGQRILADAGEAARAARVWCVLDGIVQPPP